jgi:hypothetical protein
MVLEARIDSASGLDEVFEHLESDLVVEIQFHDCFLEILFVLNFV